MSQLTEITERPSDTGARTAQQRIVVDTRPLGHVLLERSRKPLTFLVLFLLFETIIHLPTPSGLTVPGQKALAVFVVCLGLWVTSVIPLAVTSLLAIILLPMLGIIDSSKTYGKFGNEAVFFILGAFILAGVMMKCGLSARAALVLLRQFGGTPRRLVFGVLFCSAALSLVMPEHAVAAMMFPIVSEIVRGLHSRGRQMRYATSLYMCMGWGAMVGGVGTMLGGARAPLAAAIFHESTGQSISFVEWMKVSMPLAICMLPATFAAISLAFRCDPPSIAEAREILQKKIHALGRMKADERTTAFVMVLTIIAWVGWGHEIGLANIAISAVVVLFMLGVVKWKDVEEYVNWGIILMYGGAICLGWALENTGAALWIAKLTIARWADTPFLLVASFSLVSIVLTEGMSNSAVVAMLLPLGLSLTRDLGLDPRIAVFAIAVPAGLGFSLPMATPPTAIAYSSGLFRFRDVAAAGILLDLIAWVLFVVLAKLYWPAIGMSLAVTGHH